MQFQTGQKTPLSSLTSSTDLTLIVRAAGCDLMLFGLNAAGRIEDDRYTVYFNQPSSPEGALAARGDQFTLELSRLPTSVARLLLTATKESDSFATSDTVEVTLLSGGSLLGRYVIDGRDLTGQQATMLFEIYRKDGWRVGAVGQGFRGGLEALVRHLGGEVEAAVSQSVISNPALSLVKQRQQVLLEKAVREQPTLVNLIKQASVSLEKRGLGEARYRVNLVLDISASMSGMYQSGAVQRLAERALALATRLDDDGEVELYLFGQYAHRVGSLSLSNISGFVERLGIDLEGGTNYSKVMEMVLDDARHVKTPTLVLFITDGATSDESRVAALMRQASTQPIFWKFMGIESSTPSGTFGKFMNFLGGANFGFLEQLDNLSGRRVDNAHFFKVDEHVSLPDAEMFDHLVHELDIWQRQARTLGIIH